MGIFSHEAATYDPTENTFYLTEDQADGLLYRFRSAGVGPDGVADMEKGTLEYAKLFFGKDEKSFQVRWNRVPDPAANGKPIRHQLKDKATSFAGGEGIWYFDGVVYFVTKHDNRVWAYVPATQALEIIYNDDDFENPILTGVDNVTVSPGGDVIVAEDGGDMQLVAITPARKLLPIMQVMGHDGSEITGPAFDPSHCRLYFSSQRGISKTNRGGMTFEISGPFMR
jgi:secreted PhoX family phosphatase